MRRFNTIFYGFTTIVVMSFLFALNHFSVAYINSSFLSQFFNPDMVSILFSAQAVVIIIFLALAPYLASKVGIRTLVIVLIPVLQIAVLFLGFTQSAFQAIFFFILQGAVAFFLFYLLDLYVEGLSNDESHTGNTRGILLTAANVAVFLGPIFIGLFVLNEFYPPLYAFAAVALAPAFILSLTTLRHVTPRIPTPDSFLKTIKSLWCCKRSVAYAVSAHLLLQMFYTWVIVYGPLMMLQIGGFTWQTIGLLTALAILPYLFLEIPVGHLADKYFGETEMMALGFVVMTISFIGIALVPFSLLALWVFFFIAARIGAALVEITTESYFFKQVNETDSSLVSIFRIMRPAGILLAPLVALAFLPITNLQTVFAVFGAILLIGVPLSLRIQDTK